MTHPFSPAGDGEPAGPAPDATAAPGRAAGRDRPRRAAEHLARPAGARRYPGRARRRSPLAAARRVIDTFSVPGDLVAAAAAAARRRSPRRRQPPGGASSASSPTGRQRVPAARPVPGRPAAARRPGPRARPRQPGHRAGRAGRRRLLQLRLLRPGPAARTSQDAGLLFAACERVLRPGGVLAVIAGPAAPGGTLTDTAGSVVAAARAAGLVYAQHIVLVRAEIDGDRLAPAAPPAAARCTTTCWCSPSPEEKPAHDNRPPRARTAPRIPPR